jgi:hypothetical protein
LVLQDYFKPDKPLKVLAARKYPWRTPWGCKYMVLQDYFKPDKPLKVLAARKYPWRTPWGCKYMPASQPL